MKEDKLWFEGYVGIDKRITITKMPDDFDHDDRESLDQCISDEPTLDIDSDMTNSFYLFKLGTESGFDFPHEDEVAFNIEDFKEIESQLIDTCEKCGCNEFLCGHNKKG